jgi:hypothetical protein
MPNRVVYETDKNLRVHEVLNATKLMFAYTNTPVLEIRIGLSLWFKTIIIHKSQLTRINWMIDT